MSSNNDNDLEDGEIPSDEDDEPVPPSITDEAVVAKNAPKADGTES